MITLFKNGGVPMWFILAWGALALACGVRLAVRADPRGHELHQLFHKATLWAIAAGTAADFAAVGYALANMPEEMSAGRWQRIAAQGIAESMSPLVIGGALLALASFFAAVGAYRMERKGL